MSETSSLPPDPSASTNNSPARRTVARGVVAYSVAPLLGILSAPILARLLSPEGRGQYAAVMEPITVAIAFAAAGAPSAVTYFTANGRLDPGEAFRRGIRTAIPTTLLVAVLLALYGSKVASRQNLSLIVVLSAWAFVLPMTLVQIKRGQLQGRAEWRRLDWERFSYGTARFFAVLFCACFAFRFAAPYIFANLVIALAASSLLVLKRKRLSAPLALGVPSSDGRSTFAADVTRFEFIKYSIATSVGTISLVSNNRLDQVLMPSQTGSVQVGLYAISVTVAEVPLLIGAIAARNVLQSASSGLSLRSSLRAVRPFLLVSSGVVVLVVVTAPVAIPLVFGNPYRSAILPTEILTIGSALAIVWQVLVAFIAGRGHAWSSALIPLSALLTTVVGFVLYWGQVDALAAASIATAAQAIGVAVAFVTVKRARFSGVRW